MVTDVSWKEFFQDEERYADVINGIACKGHQVVTKEDLQEIDSQTVIGKMYRWKPKVAARSKKILYQTGIRDMVRKVAFGVNFAIIGIESQEMVDYLLPLRCMVYDAGEYEKQVGKIRKTIRKHSKGVTASEYLYGFRKESRLFPVITFVLYGGKDKWDGPRTLHDILDFTGLPKELRDIVADYPIYLVEIREWKDTSVFKTDVKQVFDLIRCSGNKMDLKTLIQSDASYQNLDEDAYDVAMNYIKAEELIQIKYDYVREDGKVNMCQALKELLADERTEGYVSGNAEMLRRVVINMLDLGMTNKEIRRIAECDDELIMQLRKEQGMVS